MKKINLVFLAIISILLIECSSNDSSPSTPTPVPIPEPSAINISAVSSELVFPNEIIEISGTNFTNKNYPTKVFVNNVEITPKEITDTKLQLNITDALTAGSNEIYIKINNTKSTIGRFYVMKKGWNKINTFVGTNYDLHETFAFDNSKTIMTQIEDISTSGSTSDYVFKLKVNAEKAYNFSAINSFTYLCNLNMFDENTGVVTDGNWGYISNNTFETNSRINSSLTGTNLGQVGYLPILYLENKNFIVYNTFTIHYYVKDNATTIIKADLPEWTKKPNNNTRIRIYAFGKSTTNNKFYALGILYDDKIYKSAYKNFVIESETGYNNWSVKGDTITNKTTLKYKFKNINKILGISIEKNLIESNDLLKTWKPIKTNVNCVFQRTENEWYIQSGDAIYVTKDAGQTWTLELELPTGSVVNDISFSNTKMVVAGNKGLFYLKLE